jgi:hypothetical protein
VPVVSVPEISAMKLKPPQFAARCSTRPLGVRV